MGVSECCESEYYEMDIHHSEDQEAESFLRGHGTKCFGTAKLLRVSVLGLGILIVKISGPNFCLGLIEYATYGIYRKKCAGGKGIKVMGILLV